MRNIIFAVMAIICFGVASHSTALAGKTRMTTDELTALISNTTVYGTSSRGTKFIQIFNADGTLESGNADRRDANGKWSPFEFGTWEVRDGKLCNEYTKPKRRSGGCDKFYKTDDGRYIYKVRSGKRGSFDEIVPGRAE